ncbi:hypothetical protein M885DRAFT_546081 [Pelagophyceae sp. CCMP2097]|nr:hypothetical protein M885DRAFT_546081 [Pelagophyceae sp. CCMP2097]
MARFIFAVCLAAASALNPQIGRRGANALIATGVLSTAPLPSLARPEGVNKPELLPPLRADGSAPTVIDVGVNFLTKGEQRQAEKLIAQFEQQSGFKLRVLCQQYPQTPGLAIRDYWGVDGKTIVLIADKGLKGTSNILNFNVGEGLGELLPNIFWTRLQGRYGTSRYYRDNGEDIAILNAIQSIAMCSEGCSDPPSEKT